MVSKYSIGNSRDPTVPPRNIEKCNDLEGRGRKGKRGRGFGKVNARLDVSESPTFCSAQSRNLYTYGLWYSANYYKLQAI
jgi:hypothetical protein